MDKNKVLVVKRNVKYPRLELKVGKPILILPQNNKYNPTLLIERHRKWLDQKLKFVDQIKKKYKNQKIYHRNEYDFKLLVTQCVKKYSGVIGKRPDRVRFRYMKSRWGSCNANKRITFNLMLKYLPLSLIRYVVLHEMTHMLVPNHSKEFLLHIKKEFKNYKKYEEKLLAYWFLLNRKDA